MLLQEVTRGGRVGLFGGDLTLCQCALCDDGRICPVFPLCSCLLVSSCCNEWDQHESSAFRGSVHFLVFQLCAASPLQIHFVFCPPSTKGFILKAWHKSYSALFVTRLDWPQPWTNHKHSLRKRWDEGKFQESKKGRKAWVKKLSSLFLMLEGTGSSLTSVPWYRLKLGFEIP